MIRKSDVLESVGTGTPPQSTMGPAGGSSGGGGLSIYDSWSFAQGSVDETKLTEYLSGIAIRYLNGCNGVSLEGIASEGYAVYRR